VRHRNSIASSNLKMQRTRTDSTANRLRSNSNLTSGSVDEDEVVHPVEPRARAAMLPPVFVSYPATTCFITADSIKKKQVDEDPLSWLGFEEDCIVTASSKGEWRLFILITTKRFGTLHGEKSTIRRAPALSHLDPLPKVLSDKQVDHRLTS
jgi:hypothetical protein